ncbi:long-chain fatty acid--CoA ligase [Streptomyces sp. RKND-216]|uniref:AMP-dependent synthetase/ligase n=1 Tax=Streptomyces sp. RKND-216 TaxID=2562581 RepID=UPI00109DEB42|nr:AMP-dependent synthetase/ligase [Streptomyces sp. RKND-216]THA25097.1 long-chain fatty acid--CoA ligase [Streptomyces sp. RKND-216]
MPQQIPPAGRPAPPPLVEPTTETVDGVVREAHVPPLVPPLTRGSLADLPFHNAAEDPDAVVLAREQPDGTWTDVTARQFADEVHAVAKGLVAHGLEVGDRFAIMARTTYEWTLLDFAGWAAGLITVPVYPTSSPAQARVVLQDAGVRACAVENVDHARLVTSVRGGLPDLDHLWQIDAGAVPQLVAAGRDVPDEHVTTRRARLGPQTVATVIHTSGTTGRPKGCVLTHGNFFAEVDNCVELLHPVFTSLNRHPPSTVLFLPLAHVFGRMVAVGCLRARVRLGHAPSIQTDELLADFAGFKPSFLLAIPYVLEKVHNSARATAEKMRRGSSFDRASRVAVAWGGASWADRHGSGPGPGFLVRAARGLYDPLVYRRIRDALGGHVRHVICGGSPLGERLCAFFAGAGIEVYEGYGLTETTAAVTVTPPLRPRLGTVGWPVPGTTVRIADDGEVLLRGDQVFAGYWDASAQAVIPAVYADGWLPTGDLGALDDQGYLRITGRKKDLLITSSGKNIAPAPLEDWIRAHPLVDQCLVVGDNRPHLTALITLEPEGLAHWQHMHHKRHLSRAELVHDEHLRRNLQQAVDDANRLVSQAESIRAFTVLPTSFTEDSGHLTPSLKLRRAAITHDFAPDIDALYDDQR